MIFRRESAAVLLLYSLLALVLTYPLVLHLRSRILGDGDAWLFTWNMWWIRQALIGLQHPFCTNQIHYPTGVCAYLHTWNLPAAAASVPLQGVFSLVTLYNLFALLSFVLAALALFRLARFLGIGRTGAFVAGAAFSFSPYHFSHAMGHWNLLSYQWIPFFLFSFLSGLKQGWTRRRILAASAWLVVVGLTDWYYLVFCVLAVLIFLAGRLPKGRAAFFSALAGTLKVAAVSVAALSPLLVRMVGQVTAGIPEEQLSRVFSADLQSFFLPGPVSTYGRLFEGWHSKWSGFPAELGTFVPWSVLGLAFWGWRHVDREHRPWLTVWLVSFFALSLGPFLHWGGAVYDSVLLPYGWLEKAPGFHIMRAPIRFHLMTYLGLCLLYGAGCEAVALRGRALVRGGSLGLLVLLESLSLPLMTAAKDISPFYERLKTGRDEGAIVDLHYGSRALFYQTVHGKKIAGNYGMLSRQPEEALDFLRRTPGMKELILENQIRFAANGWPPQVMTSAKQQVKGFLTLVALGQLSTAGTLTVVSLDPHQLWIDDEPVSDDSFQTQAPLGSTARRHLIRLRLWAGSENFGKAQFLRIYLNGHELSETHFEPVTEIPNSSRQGLTCIVFENISPGPGSESLTAHLARLGFHWVIVPYYGNDHFVRQGLKLKPFYQDRRLQAYRLMETSQ